MRSSPSLYEWPEVQENPWECQELLRCSLGELTCAVSPCKPHLSSCCDTGMCKTFNSCWNFCACFSKGMSGRVLAVPLWWGGCKVCSQLLHPQLNLHVAPRCLFAASSGDASISGEVAPKNTSSGSWGSWLCITEELIKLGETQALEQGLFHVAENVVGLVLFPCFSSNPCSSCTAWARSRGLSFLCGCTWVFGQ